jgi:fructose-specific phosphotransferase system IIC component
MMNRNELIAYLLAAVVGGVVAGHIAGPVGTLAVFTGIGLVGYAEMVVLASRSY